MEDEFLKDLTALLNKHSKEGPSGTPDYILAEFLIGCLETYNSAVFCREIWHGRAG